MSPPNRNHRVLTGHVTKILGDGDSYGFIDEEIFFQQINVEKGPAKVNDKVYAECQYSENLPFKWNATKVKILKPNNQANSPNHPSSSESHANNNKIPSLNNQQQSLLFNQDIQSNTNNLIAAMLPQQSQQQYDHPHQHNPPISRHDNSGGHSQDLPKKLLAQTTNPGEFFNPDRRGGPGPFLASSDAFQQQQQQPYTGGSDSLMNPGNKLTYTSQPGSAFVASQFVPFIPPSALAPQAIAGGHHNKGGMNQDQVGSSRNQNQGGFQSNKNNQSRWNERDIDRNVDRKGNNNNNNDNNRRDKPRMNDNSNRANSGNRNNRDSNNNNKGARPNRDDRDRRNDAHKRPNRDDSNARSSPAPISSAISTTSNTSSSHGKTIRRRYEPVHLPKASLMVAKLNTFDIKQRYPSTLHIPSDLKEIAINSSFRFDLNSIPKPVSYKIEVSNKQSEAQLNKTSEQQADAPAQSQSVSRSSQEIKMLHKYGVKVVLVSVPTMEEIYKRLFGPNLDSFSSDKVHPSAHFNSTVSFLCTKSLSGGSSLIGTKFDPLLDGFLPGSSSQSSSRPNLVATCIRCVRDQTGLDLSDCTEWRHLATFIYNQKNDYFSCLASVEYSYIFMPDVWSLLTRQFQQEFSSVGITHETKMGIVDKSDSANLEESNDVEDMSVSKDEEMGALGNEANHQGDESFVSLNENNGNVDDLDSGVNQSTSPLFAPDRLAELKVSDLKAELDRRNIKYKHGIKKAELVAKLKELIESEDCSSAPDTQSEEHDKVDHSADHMESNQEPSTVAEPTTAAAELKTEIIKEEKEESSGTKRKLDDSIDGSEQEENKINKKPDLETQEEKPVNLVQGELLVKPKGLTTLTTVPLSQAIQPQKHDQFEFSVVSNIFKDSLVQHFSEYIFTGLVNHSIYKTGDGDDRSPFKNPTKLSTEGKDTSSSVKSVPKEMSVDLPIDRYMNIAFTYFDSTHVGYLYVDDLNKLFLNSGYSVSKRALTSLVGEGEKFHYKSLPDISFETVYEFPKQFSEYSLKEERKSSLGESLALDPSSHTVEYNGVQYNLEKLIQQSVASEKIRVNMVERFNSAITKSDELCETIRKLKTSQKSLSNALNIQNEEICGLKRDKESYRKKYDQLRKAVESSIASLSDLTKKDE